MHRYKRIYKIGEYGSPSESYSSPYNAPSFATPLNSHYHLHSKPLPSVLDDYTEGISGDEIPLHEYNPSLIQKILAYPKDLYNKVVNTLTALFPGTTAGYILGTELFVVIVLGLLAYLSFKLL